MAPKRHGFNLLSLTDLEEYPGGRLQTVGGRNKRADAYAGLHTNSFKVDRVAVRATIWKS